MSGGRQWIYSSSEISEWYRRKGKVQSQMIKGQYSKQTCLVSLSRNLYCFPQLLYINNCDSGICNAAVIPLQGGSLRLASLLCFFTPAFPFNFYQK